MSARTILKHLHQQGRMTDYQFDVINRNLRERPQGEWKEHYGLYICSECGQIIGEHKKNYCATCGADMRGND